ncbi:phage head closure protein [Schauerella aestuarii]|uniref:phage head closure protein n=1 Tax=Schauerella aestuarii TaxID=2511204 RepID=UPI001368EA63|nr:phage head closure protein [Achromobacter aestuarii]MYZ44213.1 head-tail adaptor protein [Achromobacter aestuarii]
MLRAGSLNRAVVIQKEIGEQDAAGQPVDAWVDVATAWANIAAKSGLEVAASDSQVSAARYSIRIRYRPGITAAMRVIHAGAVYGIQAVLHDEAGRQHTDLVCERLDTANG